MSSAYTRRTGTARRKTSRLRKFVTALQVLILLGISSSVGIGLAMFISLSTVLPKIQDVEAPEATIVYSSDGVELARIFREDRTNVPLKDIPKSLREATVATEDKRFYQHSGVDMRGIARAVWGVIRHNRTSGGGSTITQQLARNVYLTQRKTVERKAQEAVLAILMERHFTKDKILEAYLNRVYYGSGAFGVQAAAKVYFGKDVGRLSLAECALLAGLTQKPSGYSPHEDLKAATGRRDTVLALMLEQGLISAQEFEKAKHEKIKVLRRAKGRNTYKAAHFVDYVIAQLRKRYGDDVLFSGGLRVYTTLNYQMQQIAEDALRSGVKRHEKGSRVTEGCFVALEPATGYIRAMVGSVNPSSQFNRCTQGSRQPGSSFKAFVYSAAFEVGGMDPNTRVKGSRQSYPGANGKPWTPRNYDGWYPSSLTIKTAVAKSVNTAAIYTAKRIGIQNVVQYAQLMGIKAELEPYLSIAIGGIKGVHPIEMASAYGTFANDGVHVEPCSVVRITNGKGETIEDFAPEGRQVISKRTCKMMDECLRGVVTSGTGTQAAAVSQARGKTGTTNDDRDAWWIGYVPGKLVAACWVGNDDYAPMRGAYGGHVCAPIWREFMLKSIPIYDKIRREGEARAAKKAPPKHETEKKDGDHTQPGGEPKTEPVPDATVADDSAAPSTAAEGRNTFRICDDSQLLATSRCPSYHIKSFARGEEPTAYCSAHTGEPLRGKPRQETAPAPSPVTKGGEARQLTTVTVCNESGLLAGPYCPRTKKRIPVEEVPTQVCNIHTRSAR